ncbi:hypothetical protein ABIB62_001350 [Mucilaginibacter sp. UYP25]|uniref:hypothetical protein n=1 Tax=unclassified Mucilaginibacter TaxID=2617802 RepID=UPI003394903B
MQSVQLCKEIASFLQYRGGIEKERSDMVALFCQYMQKLKVLIIRQICAFTPVHGREREHFAVTGGVLGVLSGSK